MGKFQQSTWPARPKISTCPACCSRVSREKLKERLRYCHVHLHKLARLPKARTPAVQAKPVAKPQQSPAS